MWSSSSVASDPLGEAAVDEDGLAGDEARFVGAEEEGHVGEVVHAALTLDGLGGDEALLDAFAAGSAPPPLDVPRCYPRRLRGLRPAAGERGQIPVKRGFAGLSDAPLSSSERWSGGSASSRCANRGVLSSLREREASIVAGLPEADVLALPGGAALVATHVVDRATP